MADTTLKTDYKDDVLDTSKNTQRKYQMIQNDDGTVSFVDVTEYSQVGDNFGAADINKTNKAIDGLNSDIGDKNTLLTNAKDSLTDSINEVVTVLDTLVSISNSFSVIPVTIDNISISKSDYSATKNISIEREGYNVIGIVGYSILNATSNGSGYTYTTPLKMAISNNSLIIELGNTQYKNNDLNVKFVANILYIAKAD